MSWRLLAGCCVVAGQRSPDSLARGDLGAPEAWDRDGGSPRELARSVGGPFIFPGFAPLFFEDRYFDGRVLLFNSFNDNLAPGDTNNWLDGYVLMVENLFQDGFESGNTGAWSATSP